MRLVASAAGFMATRASTVVTGRVYFGTGKVNLEAAHSGLGTARRANLGRKIGKCSDVISR